MSGNNRLTENFVLLLSICFYFNFFFNILIFCSPTKNAHNGQIQVNVRGIEIMNDDPSSVQILYAKIQSEALQSIADSMLKRFIDAG